MAQIFGLENDENRNSNGANEMQKLLFNAGFCLRH
jgi:hypothetical protein